MWQQHTRDSNLALTLVLTFFKQALADNIPMSYENQQRLHLQKGRMREEAGHYLINEAASI